MGIREEDNQDTFRHKTKSKSKQNVFTNVVSFVRFSKMFFYH